MKHLMLVSLFLNAAYLQPVIALAPHMGKTVWQGEGHKMIQAYHAPIDDDDAKAIVDYLQSTYG